MKKIKEWNVEISQNEKAKKSKNKKNSRGKNNSTSVVFTLLDSFYTIESLELAMYDGFFKFSSVVPIISMAKNDHFHTCFPHISFSFLWGGSYCSIYCNYIYYNIMSNIHWIIKLMIYFKIIYSTKNISYTNS